MALKSADIFNKMAAQLPTHGETIVSKVKSVYAFELRKKKADKPTLFTIDLKNGKGRITEGKIDGLKPDCTFVMLDDDFVALAAGKLNPQNAFMQVSSIWPKRKPIYLKGKMKIRGNMKAAMKFKPDIIPKDAKL